MALINCDECGHRISDKSIFCPSCGYPTHLNKVMREKATNDGSHNTINASVAPSAKSEMSDKEVEKIIAPAINEQQPSSKKDSDKKGHNKSDKKGQATKTPEIMEAASQAPAEIAPADIDNTPSDTDALAEYEATLGKPMTPETNKRNKLILYFSVLVVLLAAIGGCYYYAKSNHLQSIDEVECEPVEEVLEEDATELIPNDSVAAAIAADSISVTPAAPEATAPTATQPQNQPAATQEAPAVEQSPSVRQL